MSLWHRVKRLEKTAAGNAVPLTVVLLEAKTGEQPGSRLTPDAMALEIVYDPANGFPALPGGPHKLVIGANIYDLV